MASLMCLGSSSRGNCFILEVDDDTLIIDAGVNVKEVLKGLNYSEGLKKVRGCLVTHL